MHSWPEPHLSHLLMFVVCKQAKETLQHAHMMQGKSTYHWYANVFTLDKETHAKCV